jgi:hypothetical protein
MSPTKPANKLALWICVSRESPGRPAKYNPNLRAHPRSRPSRWEPDDDLRAVAQAIGFRAVEETK